MICVFMIFWTHMVFASNQQNKQEYNTKLQIPKQKSEIMPQKADDFCPEQNKLLNTSSNDIFSQESEEIHPKKREKCSQEEVDSKYFRKQQSSNENRLLQLNLGFEKTSKTLDDLENGLKTIKNYLISDLNVVFSEDEND